MLQCDALLVGDPGGGAKLGWVKMSSTMCSWYLSTSCISSASFLIWSFRPPATTAIHTSLQHSLTELPMLLFFYQFYLNLPLNGTAQPQLKEKIHYYGENRYDTYNIGLNNICPTILFSCANLFGGSCMSTCFKSTYNMWMGLRSVLWGFPLGGGRGKANREGFQWMLHWIILSQVKSWSFNPMQESI